MRGSRLVKFSMLFLVVVAFCVPRPVQSVPAGKYIVICDPAVGHCQMYNLLGIVVADLHGPCPAQKSASIIIVNLNGDWEGSYGVGAGPFFDPPTTEVDGRNAQEMVDWINGNFTPVNPGDYPVQTVSTEAMPVLNVAQSHLAF